MKKKSFFILMLLCMTLGAWAQLTDEENKLSITTQMFLGELNGDISFKHDTQSEKKLGLRPIDPLRLNNDANRLYASPDVIDGIPYIAAFIRLNDPTDKSGVEKVGVILQEEFDNGLFTSLIPIDNIEKVAAIENVKRINVSPLMQSSTHTTREATNVDDLLTLSADAQSVGITTAYDGTGVLLGVIDTGIDFQHIAFKDVNGNYRMKRAYVYDGSTGGEYTSLSELTTDNYTEDHGTHTASTAGGSSVIINGYDVSVTNEHAQATYGGMAPGAELYLAGVKNLSSTHLANAVKKIVEYADDKGMPVVVNNSWGGQDGPHDGTGENADIYNSLFGNKHPNHIALFSSGNYAGKSKDNEGGGYHVSAMASSKKPLRTIVRSDYYQNTDAGFLYKGYIINAWCRSTDVDKMKCTLFVLDNNTGEIKETVEVNPTKRGTNIFLDNYYTGKITAYLDHVSSDKTQIMLYSSAGLKTNAYTETTKNDDTYLKSDYTLAVELYPSSGSEIIDVWGGKYCYFTNHLNTRDYNWKAGSDDMSVCDEATIKNVISVGAYVSSNQWTDCNGIDRSMSDIYTIGDIGYFSSYATTEESPTGLQYPWITAPGARLAAAVNHYHTTTVDNNSYYGNLYIEDLVVNNSNYPYAMMEGTSMATPTVAGIVALWLQAAKEADKDLTVDDVRHVMKVTAINDDFTTGSNASHFGNGKIDALAGIRYILNTVFLHDNGDNNGESNNDVINKIINDNSGSTTNVTLSNRIFYKDEDWNTLCLPFDVDDFTGTPLEGATVKTLEGASYDSNTKTLTLAFSANNLTAIEAGVPYIVKWAEGSNIFNPEFNDITFSNVSPNEKAITINGIVSFKGSYDPKVFNSEDNKTLYLGSDNELHYPNEGMTINACRAWFELQGELKASDNDGNGVNTFRLDFDGQNTDIKAIASQRDISSGWYMLDGRQLQGKPSANGVYIHNGKKVVVQ